MAKVLVPQGDGEITIRVDGGEPETFTVTQGAITAKSKAEAERIAAVVGGTVEEGAK